MISVRLVGVVGPCLFLARVAAKWRDSALDSRAQKRRNDRSIVARAVGLVESWFVSVQGSTHIYASYPMDPNAQANYPPELGELPPAKIEQLVPSQIIMPSSGANIDVISVAYLDEFREEYQRNNKAKGRKHLRCFPQCRIGGHVDNNYCGRPVNVEVTYRVRTQPGAASSETALVSFVEFRPFDQRPSITGGQTTASIGEHWIPGVVTRTNTTAQSEVIKATLTFNSEHKCWPYLRQSHKMTANTPHLLDIFIGVVSEQRLFQCCGTPHGPQFRIFCRKKTKTKAGNPTPALR